MKANYKPFIDRVISRYEGGYGWDKKDPGGPTKYGITCFDLAEHRHVRMDSMGTWATPVRQMSLSEAEDIYATKYALGVRFDDLPTGIDCVVLDYAINSGISRACRVASALAGFTGTVLTNKVIDAIQKMSPRDFCHKMCAERLKFMHAIRGGAAWGEFGRGWGARVADLQSYADHLISGGAALTAPGNVVIPVGPKATNVSEPAIATSSAVIAGGAAGTYAGDQPWWIILVVVGALGMGAIVYEIYKSTQASSANRLVHL